MTTKYQFDQWSNLYASRTKLLKSSAIRDLLAVTERPDVIALAGGLPYTDNFNADRVVEAAQRAMDLEGAAALQYGPSEGHIGLRKTVASILADEGIDVEAEEIVITDGAQQGLDLLGKVLIDPGDTIILEAPSYVGAINAFASYEPDVVAVPLDQDGIRIDVLETELNRLRDAGRVVKFIYVVPNFHNPAGVTLSATRRQRLLELADEYQTILVEDNAYGRLRFEGEPLDPLRKTHSDVVHLGTFSKIFSPGVRLGWIIAPTPILERISFAKQSADLCSSSFAQRLVEQYFNMNSLESHLDDLIQTYSRRRDRMLEALEEFFPDEARWTKPEGGFFVWAELPDMIDTTEMLAEAIREKVAYVPGRNFFVDGQGKNFMRLAYCYPQEDEIAEGIRRLGRVVKNQLSLYRSLVGGAKRRPSAKGGEPPEPPPPGQI